VTALGYS